MIKQIIQSMKNKREFENRPLNYLQRVALEELIKEECVKKSAEGSNTLNFHKWNDEINEFSPSNKVAQGTIVKAVEEICKELGLKCERNHDYFYTSHDITWQKEEHNMNEKQKELFIKGVKELAVSMGLEAELMNLTNYTYADVVDFKFHVADVPKEYDNIEQYLFSIHCGQVGLRPFDYGKTFVDKGTTYKVVGIAPKARKYPVEVINMSNGKKYVFTALSVVEGLKK